jgi:M6 family metalloprotease-like protein
MFAPSLEDQIDDLGYPKTSFSPSMIEPVSGPQAVITILVEFNDVRHSISQADVSSMIYGSMNRYYQEVSYGKISISGQVTRWYTLNHTLAYYGQDKGGIDDTNGDGSPDTWNLVQDAIRAADADVDFKAFSHIIVLHAGFGQESSMNATDVWSAFLWDFEAYTNDGVTIRKAIIAPEQEVNGMSPIGVYTHEFGHSIGLPDLYNPNPDREHVGPWDVMARGSRNGNPPGISPAHILAWQRIRLGWLPPERTRIVQRGDYEEILLEPIESSTTGIQAILIHIDAQHSYAIETRQKLGFDIGIPSIGVLITFIDESLGEPAITVIDTSPETRTLNDAPLQVNRTFFLEGDQIRVSVIAAEGLSFRVGVDRRGPLPDLAVTELVMEPSKPRVGEKVTFKATIENKGNARGEDATVSFSLNSTIVDTRHVTLLSGTSITLSIDWVARPGHYTLTVTIDLPQSALEQAKTNNKASIYFSVGYIIKITSSVASVHILFNGQHYVTDEDGELELRVFGGQFSLQTEPYIETAEGTREVFQGWSDGEQSANRTLQVSSDLDLGINYKTQYLLKVDPNGGETSASGWFDEGSIVQVSATSPCYIDPNRTRLIFTNWSGDSSSTELNVALIMDRPRSLTANWRQQFYLRVESPYGDPKGTGWYDSGTNASISVEQVIEGSGTRHTFQAWHGDFQGNDPNASILMDKPKNITALWKTQHIVTFTTSGLPDGAEVTLTINGVQLNEKTPYSFSDWYDEGALLSFEIAPVNVTFQYLKYTFRGWQDGQGASLTSPIKVERPIAITAVYSMLPLCIITVATYGSEFAPEVQFLRDFRDRTVHATFAGSNFMRAFNTVYYSFSPTVASNIAKSELSRQVMRAMLYPLIQILQFTAWSYYALPLPSELSIFIIGFNASLLIGIAYLTPLTLLAVIMRRGRVRYNRILYRLMIASFASTVIAFASEIFQLSDLMMVASSSLVLTGFVMGPVLVIAGIIRFSDALLSRFTKRF